MNSKGGLVDELHHGFVSAAAFSRDDRRLVTAGAPEEIGSVRVYDITQPEHVIGTLKTQSQVTGVAYSPDGSTIATVETAGTLTLWDATNLRQRMTIATDATGNVAFTPDGTALVYASKGEVVRVLSLRIDDLTKLAHTRLARSKVQQ